MASDLATAALELADATEHCRACRACGDGPCCDLCKVEELTARVRGLAQTVTIDRESWQYVLECAFGCATTQGNRAMERALEEIRDRVG